MADTVKIEYTRASIYTCEGVTLQGGVVTDVPADKAKAFLAHPAVQDRIKIGHIKVTEAEKPAPKPSKKGDK